MRRMLSVAVLAAAAGVGTASPAAAADPVRIMPLGASITWGTSSSDGNGYRERLRRRLADDAGIAVDFVGSQQSGTMADRDNEGHPGFRIDQVTAGADAWLAAARPDVVLLNVGTNDTLQDADLPNAPVRMRELLDRIAAARPTATVLVSTLVPSGNATNDSRARAFNERLPAVVADRVAAGQRVRLVDLTSTLTAADIGPDTIHPTDGGYAKIADLWHSALRPVLGAGRAWPLFRTDFGAAASPLSWTDTVEGSRNVGGYCCGLPGMESGRRAETAHGGSFALMYSGTDTSAVESYSYNKVFDVHVPVAADTVLSYWIYPQHPNATSVALDLFLTDGRSLRDSRATDQFGVRAHPRLQGQGGRLTVNRWNLVEVGLGALAGGTVDQIRIGYDQPAGTGPFRGYVDDIQIVSG